MNPILLALVIAPASVDMNVIYGSPGGAPLAMDIYKPTQPGPRPAVVVIHGGGWISGDRKDMSKFCEQLVENGFVVANVQYRLAPKHKWPAMLDDVQSAVRFLRRNALMYSIDPQRFGSLGASAGGHLALMLGMCDTRDPLASTSQSSKVSAVVNFFGVSDFTKMMPTWNLLSEAVFGTAAANIRPVFEAASPLTHLDKDDARVFTFHGTADWVVPLSQSILLDERLKLAGIPHEFIQIKDSGHQVDLTRQDVRDGLQKMMDWLVETLRP
ncbi:MAG: alpha/beta hydrolase [Armatimonadota bacterium]|nr:alpha/beta hydrolase [Armatimonadota bacterium]